MQSAFASTFASLIAAPATAQCVQPPAVGHSDIGPDDELGRLSWMTTATRAAILARAEGGKVYDLATDYFVGMPSFAELGDPPYQYWLTHTPRGVLIDVAAAKGVAMLGPKYRVTATDLRAALGRQGTTLARGDVVLNRTGRMAEFEDADKFTKNPPGLSPDGAAFLADADAMVIGADNLSLETFPSQAEGDWVPVHTYLLAHKGIPIIEMAVLDELARDRVYEFAFIGGSLKFRGASAAPIRPVAIALRR